jgi:tetratricopeptide (TPR) repeat protein
VNNLLVGLLSALVSTNAPVALSNLVTRTTGITLPLSDPNDPVEKEYRKLLDNDDAAQEEVDKWIKENQAFKEQGAGFSEATLRARLVQRLEPVHKAYEDFLKRHPDHARARLAYGSFLMDINEEEKAVEQMEKARELDPNNPAAWNNLANYYGHRSPVKKAFEYYAKAIELSPNEPVYYQNLATTVFLFRTDAMEFYRIDEQQVFDRALDLYRRALKLDPNNFVLASDYAQTYYGIRPPRTDDAITAWEETLNIAANDEQREGVYLHLARLKLNAGRFDEARQLLDRVTHEVYTELKKRLERNLKEKRKKVDEAAEAPPLTPR